RQARRQAHAADEEPGRLHRRAGGGTLQTGALPVLAQRAAGRSERRYHRRMKTLLRRLVVAACLAAATGSLLVHAQQQNALTAAERQQRIDHERELQSIAVVERKVMMPMRDGVPLATDIYRPKDASGKVPTIWVRTPYNFNFWDVRNGVPADMTNILTAIKRGYAYILQNERGHFFSEGNYDILGAPRTDGDDALSWISSQPWSNGKVGTTCCSSTAEYQMC